MTALALGERETTGVYAYAERDLTWVDANKPGVRMAAVRAQPEEGLYLGYLAFERFARTGLHQHLGPASSYFLQGQLTDYQGSAVRGDMGINFSGSTHDAISYEPTLIAARLDAPVIYPDAGAAEGAAIHTGGVAGDIVNPAPEVMPDINIPLEGLPWQASLHAGVRRRAVWDYAGTGFDRRLIQMQVLPGAGLPAFEAGGLTDLFVIGGDLTVSGAGAGSGDFMVIEPGATVDLASRYGALCLVWAEAPARWLDGCGAPDPFGF
jgi:anti-sigma factor ChrR (cupin superfamily)